MFILNDLFKIEILMQLCAVSAGFTQDMQGLYNVTLRGVRVTTVVVGKQCHTFNVCVCSLIYPAHSTRRIVIFGLPGSTIFATLSHKRQDFQENILVIKCVLFMFSKTLV